MEGLLILFSSLLASVVAPLTGIVLGLATAILSAAGAILTAIIEFIIELLAPNGSGREKKEPRQRPVQIPEPPETAETGPTSANDRQNQPSKRKLFPRWVRALTYGVIAVSVLAATTLFIWGDALFLRQVKRIAAEHGYKIAYEEIDVAWFSGTIEAKNLKLLKDDQHHLAIGQASIDLDLSTLLGRPKSFESVRISDVTGRWDITLKEKDEKKQRQPKELLFIAHNIHLHNIKLESTITRGATSHHGSFVLADLKLAEAANTTWVWSLLFRSNAHGSAFGAPFTIETKPVGEGRQSHWQAEQMPVHVLISIMGDSLSMLKEGYVTLDIYDQWDLGRQGFIDVEYNISFTELHLQPIGQPTVDTMIQAVDAMLAKRDRSINCSFSIQIDQDRMEGDAHADLRDVGRLIGIELTKVMATELGEAATEKAKITGKKIKDAGTGLLNKWRKSREARPQAEETEAD